MRLGAVAANALAPGASAAAHADLPAAGIGTYYLLACADDTGAAAEISETDNCLASPTTITVAVTTAAPAAVRVSPRPIHAGARLAINYELRGRGGHAAVSLRLTRQGGGVVKLPATVPRSRAPAPGSSATCAAACTAWRRSRLRPGRYHRDRLRRAALPDLARGAARVLGTWEVRLAVRGQQALYARPKREHGSQRTRSARRPDTAPDAADDQGEQACGGALWAGVFWTSRAKRKIWRAPPVLASTRMVSG